jgi:hypothetical protein
MTRAHDNALKALRGESRRLRKRLWGLLSFLRTHASEDLGTALKPLEIAAGSFQEAAEHYE